MKVDSALRTPTECEIEDLATPVEIELRACEDFCSGFRGSRLRCTMELWSPEVCPDIVVTAMTSRRN